MPVHMSHPFLNIGCNEAHCPFYGVEAVVTISNSHSAAKSYAVHLSCKLMRYLQHALQMDPLDSLQRTATWMIACLNAPERCMAVTVASRNRCPNQLVNLADS